MLSGARADCSHTPHWSGKEKSSAFNFARKVRVDCFVHSILLFFSSSSSIAIPWGSDILLESGKKVGKVLSHAGSYLLGILRLPDVWVASYKSSPVLAIYEFQMQWTTWASMCGDSRRTLDCCKMVQTRLVACSNYRIALITCVFKLLSPFGKVSKCSFSIWRLPNRASGSSSCHISNILLCDVRQ